VRLWTKQPAPAGRYDAIKTKETLKSKIAQHMIDTKGGKDFGSKIRGGKKKRRGQQLISAAGASGSGLKIREFQPQRAGKR